MVTLFYQTAIDHVYFYKIEFAKLIIRYLKKTTPKQSITIRLNQDLMNYIRQEAERQGISVNAVISILLNESVHGRKEKA